MDDHEPKFDPMIKKHYYDRDRDLGQTFRTGATGFYLSAITLRTGFGSRPFRGGSNGAEVFVQIFNASGTPVVNNNGTTTKPPGTKWQTFAPTQPDTDDCLTGETYTNLRVVRGGFLPQLTNPATDPMGEKTAKGKYLRFALTGEDAVYLEPDTTHGFFVSFASPASERAMRFANNFMGDYSGGHGVRREGQYPAVYDPARPAHCTMPSLSPIRMTRRTSAPARPSRFSALTLPCARRT